MLRHCQSDHYFKPDRNLRQTKTQDSNQSLFNFGITVKRYYNIFKERDTHTLSSTAPHSLSAFYTVLKSIFPSHPVTAHSFAHHTFISLFKHTLNNTITCKIHTHPLTKVTHSNTGMHTVGCLSEAVAVGLWSSEAGVVWTVAVLWGGRNRVVTLIGWIQVWSSLLLSDMKQEFREATSAVGPQMVLKLLRFTHTIKDLV